MGQASSESLALFFGGSIDAAPMHRDRISMRELNRIFHEPSAARPQVLLWRRHTPQFDPQRIDNTFPVELLGFLAREPLAPARDEIHEICGLRICEIITYTNFGRC